jgi:hypothetical protein
MAEFIFKVPAAANAERSMGILESPTFDEAIKLEPTHVESIKTTARLSAFFSSADLKDLMNTANCEGLRIYPAFDVNDNFSLLAVATDVRKNDLVEHDEFPCFVSEGTTSASRLTKQQGVAVLKKVKDRFTQVRDISAASAPLAIRPTITGTRNYSKVFFSKETMNSLLSNDAMGIRFFSTQINFDEESPSFNTLAAVRVNASGEDGNTAMLSALPCPPNCGGGSYTDDRFSGALVS